MKLTVLMIFISCIKVHAQEIVQSQSLLTSEQVIRSTDRSFPYFTVDAGLLPSICLHILSSTKGVNPKNAFLEMVNGQVMMKPLATVTSTLSEMVGYSEYCLKFPLNDADINYLSIYQLMQIQVNGLPVFLDQQLQQGLLEEIQYIAVKRNSFSDGQAPTVNR